MREPAVWLGLLLLVLALLYGGLNIAERSIAGITALPYREEVFQVRHDSEKGPGLTLTFAGWTAQLYVDELLNFSDHRQGTRDN